MELTIKELKVIIDAEDFALINEHTWIQTSSGYFATTYGPKCRRRWWFMHQMVLGVKRKDYEGYIDHINQNKLDNRKANLRIVNQSLNNFNGKRRMSKSEYKGSFPKEKGLFGSKIAFNNVQIYLWTGTEIECAYAYNCAIDYLNIKHAYKNVIPESLEQFKRTEISNRVALKISIRRINPII